MGRKKLDLKNCSMIELAYAKTGSMLKAARVVAFVHAWSVVRRELGREPTIAEYVEYWKESTATAYRHLAEFREVFTKCETPGQVLDHIEDQAQDVAGRADFARLALA